MSWLVQINELFQNNSCENEQIKRNKYVLYMQEAMVMRFALE